MRPVTLILTVLVAVLATAGATVQFLLRQEALAMLCREIPADEWHAGLAAFPAGVTTGDGRRLRSVTLHLAFPFAPSPAARLIVNAGAEADDTVYVGPVPGDGRIAMTLPILSDTGEGSYWMGFRLLDPDTRTACVWAQEELLVLPAGTGPTEWDAALLLRPVDTGDGGTRLTRFTQR